MKYEPISGQPQHVSEEETMSIIRSVLTEAEDPKSTRKARAAEKKPVQADPAARAKTGPCARSKDHSARRRADDLPELTETIAAQRNPARTSMVSKLGSVAQSAGLPIFARLSGFRPTTRHLALVSVALLVVVRPHWFLITGVLTVAGVLGLFLILGADRIWRGVEAHLARVNARDPERAALLRARLDRFACRWDGILDLFPDGMVDNLYMPDMGALQNAEAAHIAAMSERLDRMARGS